MNKLESESPVITLNRKNFIQKFFQSLQLSGVRITIPLVKPVIRIALDFYHVRYLYKIPGTTESQPLPHSAHGNKLGHAPNDLPVKDMGENMLTKNKDNKKGALCQRHNAAPYYIRYKAFNASL